MKIKFLLPFVTGVFFLLSACKDSPDAEQVKDSVNDATEKVEDAVENTVDKVKEKIDESFVKKSLDENAEELEWLRAGSKMGTDMELVETAKKMIPDHEKITTDLQAYAARKNIKLDIDNDGVKIDSKTGASWDAKWAVKIKKMQRDVVDRFERVQSNADDPELKDLATNALPVLRGHLNTAEKLEARLNKDFDIE